MVSVSRSGLLNLAETVSGTHWIQEWIGSRADWDAVT